MENENVIIEDTIIQKDLAEDEKPYLSILAEQWKTSVDFAKDISNRRQSMNGLFMTGLSLLLSGILFSNGMSNIDYYQYSIIVLTICFVGLVLCYLWVKNLNYYSTLNIVKYNAIRELEKHLPAKVYTYENDNYYDSKSGRKSFSKIEKRIPMVFAFVFLVIFVVVSIPFLKELISFMKSSH